MGTALTYVGLPDLGPLPRWQTLAIAGYAIAACLIVNDTLKVILIRWLASSAAVGYPLSGGLRDLRGELRRCASRWRPPP